jgi:sialate O-acetylesterase
MKLINQSNLTTISIAITSGVMLASHARADVRLPAMFSDHMVLQRDATVPVWGWAAPGEAVTVSIDGQSKSTKADAVGKWSIKLDKLTTKEPTTMTVKGSNTLTISDVLVGEVWLGSGQSNMQLNVGAANNAAAEIAKADFPQIRLFAVERKTSPTPLETCGGKWVLCSPQTVGPFSAAAYFFGRDLHQSLKVPVGLFNSSWGGTPIEAWTSMDVQQSKPELTPIFDKWKKQVAIPYDEATAMARYEKQVEAWKSAAPKKKAEGKPQGAAPKKPMPPRLMPGHPANLFNGMIAPLIPYAMRGAIWYQGENNAGSSDPGLYNMQLPVLIKDWRQRWGLGDFPFAWVQLPNYQKRNENPGAPSNWAIVREAMLRSLSVPNTGMAIIIDSGEEANIHPKNKQVVGTRLSLWAKAKVYGQKIPYSGPLPGPHTIKGNQITISFTHADGGLVAKDGELKGFAIAGSDKKWVWAKARIEGDKVIVSSPEVSAPVAVRYAYGDNPDCNLTNGADLPASPFRTDTW